MLGQKLAEILPGDMEKVFFTLGGAEANENAIRMARAVTGRQKILARYRSYHGSTQRRDQPDRRSASLAERARDRRASCTSSTRITGSAGPSTRRAVARVPRGDDPARGPDTIAAFILEPVTGTNGILIPPDGYLQGVRELCDRYGIVMIADEIMSGFGRTGEWFAVNHWGVVPDIITMAKGLTSSYVPLGAVGMRPHIAEYFEKHVYFGGLTYNSHPLACAAAHRHARRLRSRTG